MLFAIEIGTKTFFLNAGVLLNSMFANIEVETFKKTNDKMLQESFLQRKPISNRCIYT